MVTITTVPSNGIYACDKCRKVPVEEAVMRQAQVGLRIRLFCLNCWLGHKSRITQTGAC